MVETHRPRWISRRCCRYCSVALSIYHGWVPVAGAVEEEGVACWVSDDSLVEKWRICQIHDQDVVVVLLNGSELSSGRSAAMGLPIAMMKKMEHHNRFSDSALYLCPLFGPPSSSKFQLYKDNSTWLRKCIGPYKRRVGSSVVDLIKEGRYKILRLGMWKPVQHANDHS
ncbi:hypothetical protein ACLOJK_023378 [Asimina triloba]